MRTILEREYGSQASDINVDNQEQERGIADKVKHLPTKSEDESDDSTDHPLTFESYRPNWKSLQSPGMNLMLFSLSVSVS